MNTLITLILAASAAMGAAINPSEGSALDSRACCSVTICTGLSMNGDCYTGCYPKIDEVYPDPYWQGAAGSFKVSTGGCGCYPRPRDGKASYCSVAGDGNLQYCVNNLGSFHCEF
ncbi:hypothetical protein F5883DRAFT_524629 [Diaporthe sp. PMI_573]|nr:hypothetical protein F5883DRAFT_524629 [Diaporthaceae sp. PMI_573]